MQVFIKINTNISSIFAYEVTTSTNNEIIGTYVLIGKEAPEASLSMLSPMMVMMLSPKYSNEPV